MKVIIDVPEALYESRNNIQNGSIAAKNLINAFKSATNYSIEATDDIFCDYAEYPQTIEIELYPNTWVEYTKMYEHEGDGCYYQTQEDNNPITSTYISLYPDGHLTYLWNGIEKNFNVAWR